MKITDEMVERFCRVFEANDWLPEDWAATHEGRCPTCGRVPNSDGDGGENTRAQVRMMLAVAFASGQEDRHA